MGDSIATLSVSSAVSLAQDAVEALGLICLQGEIFGYSGPYRGSGHYYFKLRDADSQIDVKIWAGAAKRALKCELEEGREVKVRGKFDIWNKRGSLSFVIDQVEDVGGGDLAKRFEQLKQKLRDQGLFDPENKQSIPPRPRKIALLCAHPSAASADFLQSVKESGAPCEIWLSACRVQGDGAAGELVAALSQAISAKPDLIVLSRGGGSLEDLWAFNEESLVRAIAACPIPIINAVGHESDFTLCDFVADERAKTPTAAALRICEGWSEVRRHSLRLAEQMEDSIQEMLADAQLNLRGLSQSLSNQSPERRLDRLRNRLSHAHQALNHAVDRKMMGLRPRLEGIHPRLEAASPVALLSRGYALVEVEGQTGFLRSANSAPVGAKVNIKLADGQLGARVEEQNLSES